MDYGCAHCYERRPLARDESISLERWKEVLAGLNVDRALLEQFEKGLDPQHPDKGIVPARVIGYGEIMYSS